jgi:hypothetical protein
MMEGERSHQLVERHLGSRSELTQKDPREGRSAFPR